MKKQFRKSFVLIVTMEYQNVLYKINFSHRFQVWEQILAYVISKNFCSVHYQTPCRTNFPNYHVQFMWQFCIQSWFSVIISYSNSCQDCAYSIKRLYNCEAKIYKVFGNERYKSFCLLHRLEICSQNLNLRQKVAIYRTF